MNTQNSSTVLGEAISTAIENKNNDLNSFVWKNQDKTSMRLMDMNYDQLQRAYTHTMDMLYNKSSYSPGKYQVKENVHTLILEATAELLLRYLIRDLEIGAFKTNLNVVEYIMAIKKQNSIDGKASVSEIFDGLPGEFHCVPIDLLMTACFDKLGVINRKMISDKFILAQGIWLTDKEKQELYEKLEDGQRRSYMDVIKERLFLNMNTHLRVDPKGLTYTEFKALIKLTGINKLSALPTDTLRILKNKILLLLDQDVDYHIKKWSVIKSNIEKVADYKHFPLKSRSY